MFSTYITYFDRKWIASITYITYFDREWIAYNHVYHVFWQKMNCVYHVSHVFWQKTNCEYNVYQVFWQKACWSAKAPVCRAKGSPPHCSLMTFEQLILCKIICQNSSDSKKCLSTKCVSMYWNLSVKVSPFGRYIGVALFRLPTALLKQLTQEEWIPRLMLL